ncbi:MAG: hypothetical protein EXQ74_06860 [Thermoleophilia bacterium]|nr:hypothetical protein [Thermoleophilia bacterium]
MTAGSEDERIPVNPTSRGPVCQANPLRGGGAEPRTATAGMRDTPDMRAFASGVSTRADAIDAAREAAAMVRGGLGDGVPDLAVVFATPDLMADAEGIARVIAAELGAVYVIGCSAEAVITTGREITSEPALSLWAARLPGVDIEPFALTPGTSPDGEPMMVGWPPHLDPWAPDDRTSPDTVLLLADPFTFPPDSLLGPDGHPTRRTVIGGMASGGHAPREHRLILGESVLPAGAIGIGIAGVVPVVSQGCRPIGPEMTITDGRDGVVRELAGRPALERVREVLNALPPDDRVLAEHGLLAGLLIDGTTADPGPGDFLIRGIIGHDPESGAIAVGERVRVGQVMRLQVRDHASATADLREALAEASGVVGPGGAGGALVFTCNGRGTRMFPEPDHDVRAIADALGDIPVGGLFCNGEIGPVGGRAYVHGFTATMAVFPKA